MQRIINLDRKQKFDFIKTIFQKTHELNEWMKVIYEIQKKGLHFNVKLNNFQKSILKHY